MKKSLILTAVFVSLFILSTNFSHASNVTLKSLRIENIGDTSAVKKYNNLSLSNVHTSKKFSLNVKKDVPAPSVKIYNNFDIKSTKPRYVESVLMRRGNSIQTIPLYRYTLPF